MATYTPNYGLHQWVPEDQFLRTDFNEDFQKIDTALGKKADSASLSSSISSIQSSMNSQISSLKARLTALENYPQVVIGTYTGDGAESRFINLGFTPKAVLLETPAGQRVTGSGTSTTIYGGLAVTGKNARGHSITTNGFTVAYRLGSCYTNYEGMDYRYIAWK